MTEDATEQLAQTSQVNVITATQEAHDNFVRAAQSYCVANPEAKAHMESCLETFHIAARGVDEVIQGALKAYKEVANETAVLAGVKLGLELEILALNAQKASLIDTQEAA